MPLPSGVKVEIEFTAGTWTDVTTDIDYNTGWTFPVGRSTSNGQPQTSTVTVTLHNPKGKYTPGVPVLSDGTTSATYPNVTPRKRLRISNSAGIRFQGFIKSWKPQTNGFTGASNCVVTAADRMDPLDKVQLLSGLMQQVMSLTPTYLWPLTDAAGSTQATEATGNGPALQILNTSQTALVFGDNGPGYGDGSGVKFAPGSTTAGEYLQATLWSVAQDMTLASWQLSMQLPANPTSVVTVFGVVAAANVMEIQVNTSGQVIYYHSALGSIVGPVITGSSWNLITATVALSGGTYTVTFSVADSTAGTVTGASTVAQQAGAQFVRVGRGFGSSSWFTGNVGYVAAYPVNGGVVTAGGARTAMQSAQGGWVGETVDARIKRYLTAAGVTSANWSIDASTVTLGSYDQGGKSALTAIVDTVASEGGGAVFYVKSGVATFHARTYRKPAAPMLTVTIGQDDDATGFQPVLDDGRLVNRSTAMRASSSGGRSSQTASDAASINTYGVIASDVTTYTQTDQDALNLAQSIVADGRNPAWRLPQITVDLLTAQHNLYSTVQTLEIGSRIRVTGLPAGQAPATQIDLLVEGWTETVNVNTYKITFDASPADNPARFVWDDTSYGRWQPAADCVLNASITNSATTLAISTPTSPSFTTNAAMYPLTIVVDAEQITLNTAPAGSASPQTFTGVTRGVNGTTAAAHSSSTLIDLAPASTWTL